MRAQPQPVFFDSFVDALISRAHGSLLTPRIKDRLRERGLDLDAKLAPAYPNTMLEGWLDVLGEELMPGRPREAAHAAAGARFITGWKATLLGRALGPLIKLKGGRSALGGLERNFRSTDNFTRIVIEDHGATGVTLRYADVCNVPHFFFGLMVEGAHLSREKNPRVTLVKVEPPGATFLCEWD